MKIGIFFENYQAGGVDVVIVNKINYWKKKDKFTLFYNNNYKEKNKILLKELKKKIDFCPLKIFSTETFFYKKIYDKRIIRIFFGFFLNYIFFYLNLRNFLKIIKLKSIDCLFIHNGGYPGGLSSVPFALSYYLLRKKTFYVVHNIPQKISLLNFIYFIISDYILSKLSLTICVSNTVKKFLKIKRFFFKDSLVIYNGVEFKRVLSKKKKGKLIFNCYSRFSEEKGINFLLENLIILKDQIQKKIVVNFYALKNIFFYKKLNQKIKKLNKFVFVKNFLTRNKIKKEISKSDFTVIPSHIEGSSLVLMESLINLKPSLISNIETLKELNFYFGKKNIVFKDRSYNDFQKKFLKILKHPRLYKLSKIKNHRLINVKYMVKKYCECAYKKKI